MGKEFAIVKYACKSLLAVFCLHHNTDLASTGRNQARQNPRSMNYQHYVAIVSRFTKYVSENFAAIIGANQILGYLPEMGRREWFHINAPR